MFVGVCAYVQADVPPPPPHPRVPVEVIGQHQVSPSVALHFSFYDRVSH